MRRLRIAVPYRLRFYRYPIGGMGITLYHGDFRICTLDWHPFVLGGKRMNRLHYHRRPGIGKHRPWQGGW